jgi:hypothetical protein
MSLNSISLLVFFSGRNVICNGEQDIGLTCNAKFENCNVTTLALGLWLNAKCEGPWGRESV